MKLISFVFLTLGNVRDAQNAERLAKHGITHVLNATPDLPLYLDGKCRYLRVEVLDLPSQNIRRHFEAAYQFIGKLNS